MRKKNGKNISEGIPSHIEIGISSFCVYLIYDYDYIDGETIGNQDLNDEPAFEFNVTAFRNDLRLVEGVNRMGF